MTHDEILALLFAPSGPPQKRGNQLAHLLFAPSGPPEQPPAMPPSYPPSGNLRDLLMARMFAPSGPPQPTLLAGDRRLPRGGG